MDEGGPQPTALERLLGVITEVRRGEGVTALLLTLDIFVLLSAYYVIKPVREALIVSVPNGAEYKSYMGAVIAATLFVAVPAYGRFAARLQRNRLIVGVSLFFVSNLVAFYFAGLLPALSRGGGALWFALGFFLWVGVFNMMVVAQFWAFAADVYTEEQGKRLFALVGLGASLGSVAGSAVVSKLVEKLGTQAMMLVCAALLCVSAALTQAVHARESARAPSRAPKAEAKRPAKERGAYGLLLAHRYLWLIAVFTVVFTLVNTNGEYILSKLVGEAAKAHGATKAEQKDWIAGVYGEFFFWVNTVGVVVQSFLVSRIVKYGGLRVGFAIFPVVALLSATVVAIFPVLAVVRVGKTAENATDYSLNNTMRNMLWLPTTRRMKYLAKQAVDSFIVRLGDVGSALVVFVMSDSLHLGVRAFAIVDVVLVGLWLWLAREILRENELIAKRREAGELVDDGAPSS
jgi:AAA family ATP:ADP antiporter